MKTDVGAAKPTLSPFAKNKNLIELKVSFLVILHLDLCPGKVWEISNFFFILHTSRRNFWIAALKCFKLISFRVTDQGKDESFIELTLTTSLRKEM